MLRKGLYNEASDWTHNFSTGYMPRFSGLVVFAFFDILRGKTISLRPEFLTEGDKALFEGCLNTFFNKFLPRNMLVSTALRHNVLQNTGSHTSVVNRLFSSLVPNKSYGFIWTKWIALYMAVGELSFRLYVHHATNVISHGMLEEWDATLNIRTYAKEENKSSLVLYSI